MFITSSHFEADGPIPAKFTCDGWDVNPELIIENVPPQAQSLALIVEDPDAPGGTFIHWTVWNIDPKTGLIKEESVPPGSVEGMTGFGRTGWGGPCPPAGSHRYFFKLYALDKKLDLPEGTAKGDLLRAMENGIVAQAELMGTYERTG